MKFAVACIGIALVLISSSNSALSIRCQTGQVRGFAAVTGDPRRGEIGGLPSRFSGDQDLFGIRYNCTGRGVQARRIDEGRYQVLFPGNPGKVAIATPLSDQASALSIHPIDRGTFEVTIRGPLVNNTILLPREVSFYIVIF